MGVALNMITGHFDEPFISAAVESATHLCDEIVFIDTAPGNNPNRDFMETLQQYYPNEVRIIDMPRGEDKDFSFAQARELARENTESEWVLRLDADEVLHEDTFIPLNTVLYNENPTAIDVAFYHHMVYPWLYQYIEPKVILFKREDCCWTRGVHEVLDISGKVLRLHNVKYHHYGYCRGQQEVFKRWQLYVDIDGRSEWYKNTDAEHILDDRISVCQNFEGTHPVFVQSTLDKLFPNWREV